MSESISTLFSFTGYHFMLELVLHTDSFTLAGIPVSLLGIFNIDIVFADRQFRLQMAKCIII